MPITNQSAFSKSLEVFLNKAEKQLETAVVKIGERGAQLAKDTTLFKNNGPLKAATEFRSTSRFSGYVIADKEYAYWLEYGNNQKGPYIIPRFKKCLHFFIGSQEIFTKKVRSHGPYKFMAKVREQLEKEAAQIIQQHLSALK